MTSLSSLVNVNRRTFGTLDGLRGVAAITVLIWHGGFLFGEAFVPATAYLAVDLFFLMSGIVIANAYDGRFAAGLGFGAFMRIRLIRLYPLYLASILLMVAIVVGAMLLLVPLSWTPGQLIIATILSLLYLPTPPFNSSAVFPLNNPAWSLFFELVANIFLATYWRHLNTRSLAIIVALSAIVLVFVTFHFGSLNAGSSWQNFWGGFPRVFCSFFLGVLISRLRGRLPSWHVHPIIVLVLAFVVLSVPAAAFRSSYDLLAVLVLFPLIAVMALSTEPQGGWRPVFSYLGLTSYALYVLHVPLLGIVSGFLKMENSAVAEESAPVFGVLFLIFVMVLSGFADKYYDVPVRRWLLRYLNHE